MDSKEDKQKETYESPKLVKQANIKVLAKSTTGSFSNECYFSDPRDDD